MTLDSGRKHLVVQYGTLFAQCAVSFELSGLRQRVRPDLRALLAVHEAGHGLVYALLFRQPPQEIKINAAMFTGGYNAYRSRVSDSERNVLDSICVSLAGRAAESAVFGGMAVTNGCECDLTDATALAAQYVRHWGFGGRLSRTDVCKGADENINTDVDASNERIEELLQAQFERAKKLLSDNVQTFLRITHALVDQGEIAQEAFCALTGLNNATPLDPLQAAQTEVAEPYARLLSAFAHQSEARLAA